MRKLKITILLISMVIPYFSSGQNNYLKYDSLLILSYNVEKLSNSKFYVNIEYNFLWRNDTIRFNVKTLNYLFYLGENRCRITVGEYLSLELINTCAEKIKENELTYYQIYTDFNDPSDCSKFSLKKKLGFKEKRKKIKAPFPNYVDIDSRVYKVTYIYPCKKYQGGEGY